MTFLTRFGYILVKLLGTARVRRFPLPEIVLWTTASQHPSESQTSECSDLLSRSRATFVIAAQRQPGKLTDAACQKSTYLIRKPLAVLKYSEPRVNRMHLWLQLIVIELADGPFSILLPKRVCHTLQKCKAEATSEQPAGKPNRNCSPRKIDVTRKTTSR